jgi:hypothetical protein
MRTISRIRPATSGYRVSSSAMFVSGAVGTRVTGSGCPVRILWISSTACPGTVSTAGSGSSGPSIPEAPCTSAATRSGWTSGPAQPAAMGTPVIPAAVHTRRAFRVVFSSVWFPATVVIASSSTAGSPAASIRARASSCPGSQSMMIGTGTATSPRRRSRKRN